MVDCVHETLGAKAIKLRLYVHLERQHVFRCELPSRLQHPINTLGAKRRHPLAAQEIRIVVWCDAGIRGGYDARRRVEEGGQFLERNNSDPLVTIITARDGEVIVRRGWQWDAAFRLVADVTVNISVDVI